MEMLVPGKLAHKRSRMTFELAVKGKLDAWEKVPKIKSDALYWGLWKRENRLTGIFRGVIMEVIGRIDRGGF